MYATSDRGLRKAAARNGCTLEKLNTNSWNVIDSGTGSLVDYELTATQVLALFV